MITSINIKNFKSFIDQNIPLSNLTLLAGLNNSGKSSVIQSLRMYHSAYHEQSPLLSGHGIVADIRSDFVPHYDNIAIQLAFEKDQATLELTDDSCSPPNKAPEFLYVGADRLGPQSYLPLNLSLDPKPKVGDRGEYVFDFINKLIECGYILPKELQHPNAQGRAFEYVLQGWLTEIAPGVNFSFTTNKKTDTSHAEIDNYRPANVGFGLSYTLPIIAAALGAVAAPQTLSAQADWVAKWEDAKDKNGLLLIVENPEAHLHPRGQTAMGRLIALAASCDVQIVVETHSEHVMDGIRIAVKDQLIDSRKVKFHYLAKDENGLTQVTTPNLDDNGKLDTWPDGFFDQSLKNRAKLAKRNK